MTPGAALAFRLLPKYLGLDAEPVRARELLRQIGQSEEWLESDEDLAEQVEAWEKPFLRRVREELSSLHSLGRVAYYSINSSSPNYLQGCAFVEPRDPPDVAAQKRALAKIRDYGPALAALTPRDFEVLCGSVLSLLGAENVTITPHSRDEGIDFYGVMRAGELAGQEGTLPSFTRQASIWLLGQAKRYIKTKVATPDIRDLVGAVELAKSRAFSSTRPKYKDLDVRVCDPVFFLFFTTGALTSAGWQLAQKSGVIALDGEMIADFLAGRGIGVVDGDYSDAAFRAWLREQRAGQ